MRTRVVKDMAKYRSNVIMGLTKRELIFGVGGFIVVFITYFFLPIPGIVSIAIGTPLFFVGFIKFDRLPFEKFMYYFFESQLVTFRQRYYEKENKIYEMLWGESGRKYREKSKRSDEVGTKKKLMGFFGKKNRSEIDTDNGNT